MSIKSLLCILLAFGLFLELEALTYPVLSGYEISDLYGQNTVDLANLASLWTVTNPQGATASRITFCVSLYIMGGLALLGPNTILERTYGPLPVHTHIAFLLSGGKVNPWISATDSIEFYIDNQLLKTLYPMNDYSGSYDWYDMIGVQPHSGTSLTLKYVISNSGYASASFGLHNIRILLRTTSPSTSLICSFYWNQFGSPCNFIAHYYSGGSCDGACNCCFGPGPSNCLNCANGHFFDGINCLSCDSSCLTCSGTSAHHCVQCPSGKFLQQDNNTCTTDCNPPYIQDGLGDFKVCKPPCEPSEKITYNAAGQVVCQEVPYEDPSTKKITSSAGVSQLANTFISRALLLVSTQSSILLLSGCLADMLKYIRYMDIDYSIKLLNLFNTRGIFEMMTDRFPSVNNMVVSKFTNNPLSPRFEEYSEQSSFIANSWQWLATLALIMIILISNYLLFQINSEFIKTVSTKIKGILQWNYCISTFVSYFGNLVFYSSLEFLTISYHKSGLEILSSTLCTLISITALIFFIKVVTIIYEARKSSILSQGLRQGTAPAHHSYHEKYGIIFEGFKTNSWLQQSYFVIYLIRISIFNMVIVYLYAYPISQGIIISTLSLLMLLYLMFTSPLKGKLDLVQTGIQEVILFIVNICVTLLALLDHGRIKDGDGKMRTNVEDIIFWSNIIFIFLVLIYSLIIMGQQICMAYKKLLAWYRRKKITAIQREEGVGTSMQIQDKPSLNNAPIKDRLDSSALEKSQAYFGLLSSSSMRQDIRIGYPYNLGETKANNNSLNRFLSFDHTNTPTFGFNKDPSKIKSANLLHLQDLENTKKRGLGQFNQKKFEQNVSAVNSDIERRDEGLKMSKARNMTRKDISIHPEPNQGGIRNSGPSESYKQQQAQESGLIKNKEIAYEVKANQNQEEYEATLTSHNYSESDALSAPQAELCTIGRTQQHFELALVGPRDVQKEESPELNVISGGLTNEDRDRIGNLNQTNYHEDLNARQQDERPHNNFKLKMLLEPRSEASAIEGLQDSPEIKRDVTMNKQDKLRNYFSFLNDEALQRVPEDEGNHVEKGDSPSLISRFLKG